MEKEKGRGDGWAGWAQRGRGARGWAAARPTAGREGGAARPKMGKEGEGREERIFLF